MEDRISPGLRNVFLVHTIVAAGFGIPLFLVPGFFLTLVGWRPEWVELPAEWGIPPEVGQQIPGTTFVDPVLTRILGAALIALAVSSILGWRASSWREVKHTVILELAFCVFSAAAVIFDMIRGGFTMPTFGYVTALIFVIFSVAWAWSLRRGSDPG